MVAALKGIDIAIETFITLDILARIIRQRYKNGYNWLKREATPQVHSINIPNCHFARKQMLENTMMAPTKYNTACTNWSVFNIFCLLEKIVTTNQSYFYNSFLFFDHLFTNNSLYRDDVTWWILFCYNFHSCWHTLYSFIIYVFIDTAIIRQMHLHFHAICGSLFFERLDTFCISAFTWCGK